MLLTSPLPRARVTAEIAAQAFKRIEPRIEPALADGSAEGIVSALKTHPLGATVALVGHEPVLGVLRARLLGASQGERLALEKGGAALVDLPPVPRPPDGSSGSWSPEFSRLSRVTSMPRAQPAARSNSPIR